MVEPPVAEDTFVVELVEALEVVEEAAFDDVEVLFIEVEVLFTETEVLFWVVVPAAVVVAVPGRHCE